MKNDIEIKIIVPKGTKELFADCDLEFICTKAVENSGSVELWKLADNISFKIVEEKERRKHGKKG